ncbi:maf-like protein DDB_G0281937 isoform X5 [Papaver somniferum]|uniref:maf-like protein DDB_G0281937 isoform X5 n=1 Tax=Papaver somniferum TaxID=3469 RepID=UPI000E6F8B99|nr:maf-like protein DDB_G0281937 isoform X5 [Papaver somniferum]XP_026435951.1 maf-like protein DDB_G0281937 isoform X5 [Papaver somniferum]
MSGNGFPSYKIILGSSSKARREILTEMGYEYTILTADIDEKNIRMEKPEKLVVALAEAKAVTIMSRLQLSDFLEKDAEPTLLITADTVVVYEGAIREKPTDKEEARQFLKDYSGGLATVVGSVLVTNLKTGISKGGYDRVEMGTTDSVMGLSKALVKQLIFQSLIPSVPAD